MFTAYTQENGQCLPVAVTDLEKLESRIVWVDLVNPDDEERALVRKIFGIDLPKIEAIGEIEATSRFFEDSDGFHLRSFFLQDDADVTRNVAVGFIVTENRVFTVHSQSLYAFDDFQRQSGVSMEEMRKPSSILLGLFEIQVDRIADVLERLYESLETHSKSATGIPEKGLEELFTIVAQIENVNGNVRLSLMDKQQVLSILTRRAKVPHDLEHRLNEILRDIDSLITHSTFISGKVNFLTDIIMGRINLEENKIIKIFSMVAVVFLPPTLIASIYGMNFHFIPEFGWKLGYPLAIMFMIAAGVVPYVYFKHKG